MKSDTLYLIKVIDSDKVFFKIGITNKIEKRIKSIKTGNHRKTELVFTEKVPEGVKVTDLENWLHSVFGENREEGEWFSDLTERDIRKKIIRFFMIT